MKFNSSCELIFLLTFLYNSYLSNLEYNFVLKTIPLYDIHLRSEINDFSLIGSNVDINLKQTLIIILMPKLIMNIQIKIFESKSLDSYCTCFIRELVTLFTIQGTIFFSHQRLYSKIQDICFFSLALHFSYRAC